MTNSPLQLDGRSLTIDEVVSVARSRCMVELSSDAAERMNASRRYVDDLVQNGGAAVYGINTGLGVFSSQRISTADAAKLSRNLVLSHAVGVGDPFPEEIVRAALLIRANTLAVGHSGVRPVVVEALLAMLNADVVPTIPQQGSLGSSGDLAPLCHLALAFTRERSSEETASDALRAVGIEPVVLEAKEGLAVSNGTSFSAATLALASADAENVLRHAELGTALVFEALLGVTAALDERLHQARRHRGQQAVAARLRSLLAGSTYIDSTDRVQDAYSLRCAPQILGPIHDTLEFVRGWVDAEINAATDNPLVFDDGPTRMTAISGGNFHGEVLALGADFLSIAMAEVGALAERQIDRLLHTSYSFGLPAMLVHPNAEPGLNSGLMMPHYTAVSLVLENQSLAHPNSVHSLPVSAGQEDLNANSQTAARRLRSIVENVERVLAIQLFTAAQAVDLRLLQQPQAKLAPGNERALQTIRRLISVVEKDRCYHADVHAAHSLIRSGTLVGSNDESA